MRSASEIDPGWERLQALLGEASWVARRAIFVLAGLDPDATYWPSTDCELARLVWLPCGFLPEWNELRDPRKVDRRAADVLSRVQTKVSGMRSPSRPVEWIAELIRPVTISEQRHVPDAADATARKLVSRSAEVRESKVKGEGRSVKAIDINPSKGPTKVRVKKAYDRPGVQPPWLEQARRLDGLTSLLPPDSVPMRTVAEARNHRWAAEKSHVWQLLDAWRLRETSYESENAFIKYALTTVSRPKTGVKNQELLDFKAVAQWLARWKRDFGFCYGELALAKPTEKLKLGARGFGLPATTLHARSGRLKRPPP